MDFLSDKFYPCNFFIQSHSGLHQPPQRSLAPGFGEPITRVRRRFDGVGYCLAPEGRGLERGGLASRRGERAGCQCILEAILPMSRGCAASSLEASLWRYTAKRRGSSPGEAPRSSGPLQHRLFQLSPQSRLPERN